MNTTDDIGRARRDAMSQEETIHGETQHTGLMSGSTKEEHKGGEYFHKSTHSIGYEHDSLD